MDDLKRQYRATLADYDRVVSAATAVSQACAGQKAEPASRYWAALLFTRLCNTSVSLLLTAPHNRLVTKAIEHWDFAAVASLVRNLVECHHVFFYLGVEDVDPTEWKCRIDGFHLHDCLSRMLMFRDFDPEDPQVSSLEEQAEDLTKRLKDNSFFREMKRTVQKRILKGDAPMYLTRSQIAERLGFDAQHFRGVYRLLSAQTHSFPMSFYRMEERGSGRGLLNKYEIEYTTHFLRVAENHIKDATRHMLRLFPGSANRVPKSTADLLRQAPDEAPG